jgi:Short-chain dehydrogenases of various substrate specificities
MPYTKNEDDAGFVAVVTGATRGLGRGAARGLAMKGGTIFVTGRDASALEATVAEIEANGGAGRAILCDHRDDEQVRRLFEDLAEQTGGRLDLLLNNAATVPAQELLAPGGFWTKSLGLADMITVGLRSNYVAAYYAAPLMVARGRGLIANISFYGASSYFHGPAYGAAKAGTDKMSFDMATELRPEGVSVISYWPGFVLTDAVRSLPPEALPPEMRETLPTWETPELSGLVIRALAYDPDILSYSGKTIIGAELAQHYGLRDLNGAEPISHRETMGSPLNFWPSP